MTIILMGISALVGCFIGWTFPQPQWAKDLQAWVTSFFRKPTTPPAA